MTAALAALLLASPGSSAQEPAPLSPAARGETLWRIGSELVMTRWRLEAMGGEPVPAAQAPTLEFLRDLQVRGSAACNRYVGPFASRADKGSFGPLRASKIACPGEGASIAADYLDTLSRGWLMRLENEGETLLVYPRAGSEPLRFARLP